jgi:hypothetical protein
MSKIQLYEALGLGGSPRAARGAPQSEPRAPVAAAEVGITSAPARESSHRATSAAPPTRAEGVPYVERGAAIPDSYGDDKLVAMVRDPRWVFLYWELEGGGCARIIDSRGRAFMKSARWVVREFKLDRSYGTYRTYTDVPIDAAVRNWYLKVEPAARYRFEIGVVSPSGEFIAVAASAEIETPREGLSEEVDEQWMLVREDLERLIEAMGGMRLGVPGSALGRRFEIAREVTRAVGRVGISSLGLSRAVSSRAVSSLAVSSRAISSRGFPGARAPGDSRGGAPAPGGSGRDSSRVVAPPSPRDKGSMEKAAAGRAASGRPGARSAGEERPQVVKPAPRGKESARPHPPKRGGHKR